MKKTLPLHTVNGEPYYLGVFLVGAYQEILGDLHNLFGDTNAVHVSLDAQGNVVLDTVIKGDTVREVLDYVEFDADMLIKKLRHDVELAVREGRLTYERVRTPARVLRRRPSGLHLPRRTPRAISDCDDARFGARTRRSQIAHRASNPGTLSNLSSPVEYGDG